MNDNQNNDLNINKVNQNGSDDIFEKIKAKDNNLNNKEYGKSNNSSRVIKQKQHKKIVIQTRIEEDDFLILKEHLLKKGYDTYSTGVRGILKMYMRDNGLID